LYSVALGLIDIDCDGYQNMGTGNVAGGADHLELARVARALTNEMRRKYRCHYVRETGQETRPVPLKGMVLVCGAEVHDACREAAPENIAHQLDW
jgi:hypothetical protein